MATKKNKTSEADVSEKALATGAADSAGTEENKPRKGGLAETVKRWKPGDYLRQLSTVIIGIIVTFGGSGLIQQCSERRDTVHILEMVKEELQKNVEILIEREEILRTEFNGAVALMPYMHNPEELPDSLGIHLWHFIEAVPFALVTNSFEVLKNSSQIQNIRNKTLLRELFTTYELMVNLQDKITGYNAHKQRRADEFLSSMDSDIYNDIFSSSDHAMLFTGVMKLGLYRNHLVASANSNFSSLKYDVQVLTVNLPKTIKLIDEEIGYKDKPQQHDAEKENDGERDDSGRADSAAVR